jgi:hypothetical protein
LRHLHTPKLFVVLVGLLMGLSASAYAHPVRSKESPHAAEHDKPAVRDLEKKVSKYKRQIPVVRRATWKLQQRASLPITRAAKDRCEKSRGLAYLKWCYNLWVKRHHKWQKYVRLTPHDTGYLPPTAARQLGKRMAALRGWTGNQWECLDRLWGTKDGQTLESGWYVRADNPSSEAYGIPQALPGEKMGAGWLNSAFVQIKWGLKYIRDRYKTPCGALSYRLAVGSY